MRDRHFLERTYGSYATPGHAPGHCTVWVAARPARMGGTFAIGCSACAWLCQSNLDQFADDTRAGVARKRAFKQGAQWANTKWARFEISDAQQIAVRGLRQHEQTLQHRKAIRARHAPPAMVERVFMQGEDEELFRGAVPQPQHWVEAWGSCSSVTSFRQAEKHGIVMGWLSGRRGKTAGRKAFAAMMRVMAFVLRVRKRKRLRSAMSISIGLDDRGSYRLITYRCDTPCPDDSEEAKLWPGWASGCLGVLRRGGEASSKTLEDTDDDYSKKMADSIALGFRRVATDFDGRCDEDAAKWMMLKVRIGIADGAASAQKCLRFLACGPMPNMLVIGRDFAHAARIATRDPLLAVGGFESWWQDVFDSQFALVPTIQNSEEWTEKLLLCQRKVLGSRGEQGAGLKVVAKCLQFAKQRFDSVATPMRQFCCLLVAIAMLLAHKASDHRAKADVRSRARRRLQELPHHVPTVGLCASYAEECIRFVRVFDKAHHDPSRTWAQLSNFTESMRVLFLEGHIWNKTDGVGESGSDKTLLEIVIEEAKSAPTIYYDDDGRVLRLCHKPSEKEQQALQTSVHQVTEALLGRLEVEFGVENAIVLFTALDLSRWRKAFLQGRAGNEGPLELLRRHSRRLLTVWRMYSDRSHSQLEGVVAKLVQDNRESIDAGLVEDFRSIWVQALRPGFSVKIDRVQELIRIYMAASDGTCGVERDLGALTRVLAAHSGPTDEDGHTISHLVDVLLDGPKSKEEIATLPEVGESGCSANDVLLLPTSFSRECVLTWSNAFGRRFLVYQKRPGCARPPREKKTGTMASVIRSVANRTEGILKGARDTNGGDTTVLGVPRGRLIRRDRLPAPSPKLKKFTDLTGKKRQKFADVEEARAATRVSFRNPYKIGMLNPHRALRLGRVLNATPKPEQHAPTIEPRNGVIAVADCCSQVVPETLGYDIVKPGRGVGGSRATLDQLMRAQVIVWDCTWLLDGVARADFLVSAIVAIAFGKATMNRARWRGPRPHTTTALVQYLPAARSVKATLMLGGELRSHHGSVCDALRLAVRRGTSWSLVDAAAAGVRQLCTLTDVRNFLRDSRRVYTRRTGVVTDLLRRP